MSSPLSHSPSRSGRQRTKGTAASEGAGALLRGALSGNIGASPFSILATTPELPLSTGTCLTASTTSRSSPSTSRPARGQAGLSLRRANSSGNGLMRRAVSGGVTPPMPTASGPGRRGVLLRRLGTALIVLQLLAICVLLARPSLVNSLHSAVKSASASHWASHRAHTTEAAQVDETSTIAIVSKLAADSRRSTRAETTAASRRERLWPSSADLNARLKQQQQQKQDQGAASQQQSKGSTSSSQPVRLAASNAAEVKAATGSVGAGNDNTAQAVSVANTAAVTSAKAVQSTAGEAVAASGGKGGTTSAVVRAEAAAPVRKSASFPPFTTPVVPFPGRAANAPHIVGVVFYGRRDRVRILDCYLQRNMMRNGGLLVYVVFVTATWQPEDVEFLDRLIAARAGDYRKVYPQRIDKGYTGHYAWMDPATMYVKIDDDVVYIADHAIDHMLLAHNLGRYHLISANVVNHQPLELPHSQAGAHYTFEQARPGDKTSWKPVMRQKAVAASDPAKQGGAGGAGGNNGAAAAPATALEPVPFVDNGWDVWGDWRRAANVHYSFLANHAAGRLGVYNFPPKEQLWDFNAHFGYTRWRVNMIMFKGSTIDVHVYNMSSTIETYPGDDEDYITRILPKQLNRTSAAVSQALAVHFSFYMQRAGLENSTDLLDRYTLLAERTCGRLISASP